MKRLFSTVFGLGLGLAVLAAAPALAAPRVCLNVQDIRSSEAAKDGAAITFQMKDGKVYRNDLHTPCSDLRFNGFAWTLHGTEQVCDDQMSLKVINSPQICQLGKFTQLTPAPKG